MLDPLAEFDALRRRIGFNRPAWLELFAGVDVHTPDDIIDPSGDIDPKVRLRMRKIEQAFENYTVDCTRKLEREFTRPKYTLEDGTKLISTVQVARAFGLGDFHISTIRSRGVIKGTKMDDGYHGFTMLACLELLGPPKSGYQSPLCASFQRFLSDVDA